MRKLLLSAFGASMLAIASAANAVVILPGAPLTWQVALRTLVSQLTGQ